MLQKPEKLEEILSEKRVCEWLDLPCNPKTGQSRVLGHWIIGGLKHAEKSGRRFFFAQDVIDYLWDRYQGGNGQAV